MRSRNNSKKQNKKTYTEPQPNNVDVRSAHPLYRGIKNWAIKKLWNALIIEPEKESPVNKIVKPIL
jgi:hypothetical protein